MGKNVKTIYKIVKKCGIGLSRSYRKYIFNEDFFESINNEAKAYWLGFLFADGCVAKDRGRVSIALAEIDEGHLLLLQKCLGIDNKLSYNPKTKSFRLTINSNKMKEDLIKLGCLPNKSYTNIMPPILNEIDARHFIRGLFDGDGCLTFNVTENRYKVSFIGSENVIKFINNILHKKTGINLASEYIDTRWKCEYTREITWGGKQNVIAIMQYLYKDSEFFLQRKYDKFMQVDLSDIRNKQKTKTYAIAQRGRPNAEGINEQCMELGQEGKSNCLTTVQKDSMIGIENGEEFVIRKLTPVECERLMGLTDGYTKAVSNTQRYKCLGNGFHSLVIQHILQHLDL